MILYTMTIQYCTAVLLGVGGNLLEVMLARAYSTNRSLSTSKILGTHTRDWIASIAFIIDLIGHFETVSCTV